MDGVDVRAALDGPIAPEHAPISAYRVATISPDAVTVETKRGCRPALTVSTAMDAGPRWLSTTAVTATIASTPRTSRRVRVISQLRLARHR
jgi:hypothetical protein